MNKKKIAILLPFKDHFVNSEAGSASIWIKDFNKKSIYKNNISVYGQIEDVKADIIDKPIIVGRPHEHIRPIQDTFKYSNYDYIWEEPFKINCAFIRFVCFFVRSFVRLLGTIIA